MAKVSVTITFDYEMDETDFPGGITESDIREEEHILHEMVKRVLSYEEVKAVNLDVSVELI